MDAVLSHFQFTDSVIEEQISSHKTISMIKQC